jgi:hypothetical protein
MNPRQARRAIYALSTILSAAAGYILWAAWTSPLDLPLNPSRSAPETASLPPVEATSSEPRLDDVKRAATRSFQRPLFDPPPPRAKPAPERPRAPPPRVVLLATLISESPKAMIELAEGKVEFKRVGDSIGEGESEAKIVAIEKDLVTLEHQGQNISVRLVEGGRR